MNLKDLAEIVPTVETEREFVHFGPKQPGFQHGPSNVSPVDIFAGSFTGGGMWLDTVDDARALSALIRMAIKISYALDPNDPIAAMRLIPGLIGPDAFGGPDDLNNLNEWLKNCKP